MLTFSNSIMAQYALYDKAKNNYNPDRCYRRAQKRFDKGHYNSMMFPLKRAIRKGHEEANFLMGRCYDEGKGVRQSYDMAVSYYYVVSAKNAYAVERIIKLADDPKWLDRAADAGFFNAIWASAEKYYARGNYAEAKKYYRKAVDRDYAPAYYRYGELCEKDKDYKSAQYYYMKAVNSGTASAQGALHAGILYYTGGVERNYKQEMKQNAITGFEEAMNKGKEQEGLAGFGWGVVSFLYNLSGAGQKLKSSVQADNTPKTEIDYNKAFKCLDEFNNKAGNSYEKDYERGWYYLGLLYYNGIGTPNHWGKAANCFYKASQHDSYLSLDIRANMYKMMGDCYLLGKYNATKNFKMAIDSYLKVFEIQNIISADINKSTGEFAADLLKWFVINKTKADNVRAYMLSSEAMCRIAQCALGDRSLTTDANIFSYCDNARKNYRTLPLAWLLTGECYEKGIGVQRNYAEAYKCYSEVLSINVNDNYLGEGFERTMREQENKECITKAQQNLSNIKTSVEREGDQHFANGNYIKALENYSMVGTRTLNSAKCYEHRAQKNENDGDRAFMFFKNEYEGAVSDYAMARSIYYELGYDDMAENAKNRGLAVIEKCRRRVEEMLSSAESSNTTSYDVPLSEMDSDEFDRYWMDHKNTPITFEWETETCSQGFANRTVKVHGLIDGPGNCLFGRCYRIKITSISKIIDFNLAADKDANSDVLACLREKYEGEEITLSKTSMKNLQKE